MFIISYGVFFSYRGELSDDEEPNKELNGGGRFTNQCLKLTLAVVQISLMHFLRFFSAGKPELSNGLPETEAVSGIFSVLVATEKL